MKCKNCSYLKKNETPCWCLLQSVNKIKHPEDECDVDCYSYNQMDVQGKSEPEKK